MRWHSGYDLSHERNVRWAGSLALPDSSWLTFLYSQKWWIRTTSLGNQKLRTPVIRWPSRLRRWGREWFSGPHSYLDCLQMAYKGMCSVPRKEFLRRGMSPTSQKWRSLCFSRIDFFLYNKDWSLGTSNLGEASWGHVRSAGRRDWARCLSCLLCLILCGRLETAFVFTRLPWSLKPDLEPQISNPTPKADRGIT